MIRTGARILPIIAALLFCISAVRAQSEFIPAAEAFDGERAFEHIVQQCDFGPRIAGTPAHRKTRNYIVGHLEGLGWEVETQKFFAYVSILDESLPFENIIARLDTPATKSLVLSCHWDTRPIADKDSDPAMRNRPIPGANDGGSGVAVLLELARVFNDHPPPFDLLFVFFDAEDYGTRMQIDQYCLGSQYLVEHPPESFEFIVGVNLDMVADADQLFYPDKYSMQTAAEFVDSFWDVGKQFYPEHFKTTRTKAIIDDHLPFVKAGYPYFNVIDLDYQYWHTMNDIPSNCVPESLTRIGKIIVQWMFTRLEKD